jgi:hypothetical protein
MAENKKPVRKINPALLLQTAQEQEKAKPAVETTNFGARPRNDWRARSRPVEAPVSPVAGVADNSSSKPVEGVTVSPVAPESTSSAPAVEVDEKADAVAKAKDVEERFLERQQKLAASRKQTKDSDASVEETSKPVRRVNSRFALDDEVKNKNTDEDEVEAPAKAAPQRFVRPGLLMPGERTQPHNKPFVTKPDAKPRSVYTTKVSGAVEAGEWDDDTSSDTGFGLGAENDSDLVEPQYSKGFHLTERDIIVMRFLARYRYGYTDTLARLVDTIPRNITNRMRTLEKRGFVRKQPVTERQYLWMTRKAGNLIADISFGEIKKGAVSYATIAHTIGLANLGVELEREAGGKDILGERADPEDEPFRNRFKLGVWNNPEGKTFGEMTVTEREIRQGQMRWRGGRSTAEMRNLVDLAISSPEEPQELLEGNEGLFVVYGLGGADGEHIPDLVVARERAEDGTPQHLAIELELTGKPNPQWKRILRWYRDNGGMYSKVYYFTHKRSIATALRRADEEVGLGDRLVIRKYIPVNGRMPFWG